MPRSNAPPMTSQTMEGVFNSLLRFSRAEERKRWKKSPGAFADRAAAEATRGWAFLLPKGADWEAAMARHAADKAAIREAGLVWIQARLSA